MHFVNLLGFLLVLFNIYLVKSDLLDGALEFEDKVEQGIQDTFQPLKKTLFGPGDDTKTIILDSWDEIGNFSLPLLEKLTNQNYQEYFESLRKRIKESDSSLGFLLQIGLEKIEKLFESAIILKYFKMTQTGVMIVSELFEKPFNELVSRVLSLINSILSDKEYQFILDTTIRLQSKFNLFSPCLFERLIKLMKAYLSDPQAYSQYE